MPTRPNLPYPRGDTHYLNRVISSRVLVVSLRDKGRLESSVEHPVGTGFRIQSVDQRCYTVEGRSLPGVSGVAHAKRYPRIAAPILRSPTWAVFASSRATLIA